MVRLGYWAPVPLGIGVGYCLLLVTLPLQVQRVEERVEVSLDQEDSYFLLLN